MRYKPKSIAALHIALGGLLPVRSIIIGKYFGVK